MHQTPPLLLYITLMIFSLPKLRTQQLTLSLISNHSKQVISGQERGLVAAVGVIAQWQSTVGLSQKPWV